MKNKRQVPMKRSWLRRYLRDRLQLNVPSKTDDDEWQKICDAIPARDWEQAKIAWHQHRQNDKPRYMQYVHATNEDNKRLGLFWQRLITQEFVSEEDAKLLAENFFQESGGYSDEMAKGIVRKILTQAADRYRTKVKANPGNLIAVK